MPVTYGREIIFSFCEIIIVLSLIRRKLSLDGNDNDEDLDDEEEDENTFIPLEGSMEDED